MLASYILKKDKFKPKASLNALASIDDVVQVATVYLIYTD